MIIFRVTWATNWAIRRIRRMRAARPPTGTGRLAEGRFGSPVWRIRRDEWSDLLLYYTSTPSVIKRQISERGGVFTRGENKKKSRRCLLETVSMFRRCIIIYWRSNEKEKLNFFADDVARRYIYQTPQRPAYRGNINTDSSDRRPIARLNDFLMFFFIEKIIFNYFSQARNIINFSYFLYGKDYEICSFFKWTILQTSLNGSIVFSSDRPDHAPLDQVPQFPHRFPCERCQQQRQRKPPYSKVRDKDIQIQDTGNKPIKYFL